LIAAVAFVLLAAGAPLGLGRAAAARGAPPRTLEIVFVGPKDVCGVLAGAILPMLPGNGRITWRMGAVAEPPLGQEDSRAPGAARLWIQAGEHGTVHIVAAMDGMHDVRSIDTVNLDAVTTEIVAQIVREAALALFGEGAPPRGAPIVTADSPEASGLPEGAAATPSAVPPPWSPFGRPAGSFEGAEVAPPAMPSQPRMPLGRAPGAPECVAVQTAPVSTTPSPVTLSAGYITRNIFGHYPAAGRALAQGATVGAALLIKGDPISFTWSLSLENLWVTAPAVSNGFAANNVAAHYSTMGAYSVFAITSRLQRFVEASLGFGGGVARNTARLGLGDGDFSVNRGAARTQLSVTAIDLAGGLEVTGALTLDWVFGTPYQYEPPGYDGGSWEFPSQTSFQLGALLMAGWRF
jgi:hypothetical protein